MISRIENASSQRIKDMLSPDTDRASSSRIEDELWSERNCIKEKNHVKILHVHESMRMQWGAEWKQQSGAEWKQQSDATWMQQSGA